MPSSELSRITDAVIASIEDQQLSDDVLHKLYSVFSESIVLGALDLIDQEKVIKHTTPWSYPQYEVLGSTDKYRVFLDMTISATPFFCSCPAFAYIVLSAGTEIMCKHVLAARLADGLKLFIERPMSADDVQAMMLEQYSNVDYDTPMALV